MVCEYIEVECTNGCKKMIMMSEFSHHLATECEHRLVECELCSKQERKIEMEVSQVFKTSWLIIMLLFVRLDTSGISMPKTIDSV
jgi:hypothetical protein